VNGAGLFSTCTEVMLHSDIACLVLPKRLVGPQTQRISYMLGYVWYPRQLLSRGAKGDQGCNQDNSKIEVLLVLGDVVCS
jgi:hypothetical protein